MARPARAATQPFEIHVGFLEAVDSLNPFRGLNDPSFELYGMIYDYLYSFDQDGNLVPNLATNAVPDPTWQTWTYWIRQGVKWSDGTALTADDVAFTINYNIQNFFLLFNYEPYVNRIVQCTSKNQPYCGAQDHSTNPAIPAWNVTVYFDRPFVPGKGLFVPIIQKAQWQGISANVAQSSYDNPNPIGTGPFIADVNIYQQWQGQPGVPLVVRKNPNYHPVGNHTGPASVDTIYFQQFNDENTLVAALRTGAVQLAKVTPYGYGNLRGVQNIGEQEGLIVTEYWNEIGITQIDSNSVNGKRNPARWDVNVRRALEMATNKKYIVDTKYAGKGLPGDSLMTPITPQWWYDPSTNPNLNLSFNLVAANALLNQSGYDSWTGGSFGQGYRKASRDIPLSILTNACPPVGTCSGGTYPTNASKVVPVGTVLSFTMDVRQEFQQEQDTATYLVAQWAQIGVQLQTPNVVSESTLASDVYKGLVDTYIWFWSGDPDPNYLLSIESGYTLDGWNDNWWNNAEYNSLYVQHLSDVDFNQRQIDVRKAQQIQYESAVYIIYIFPYGEWVYRTDQVTNWPDFNKHPYAQLDAFWGANPLFFMLQPGTSTGPTNNCPTKPVINPGTTPPYTAYANFSTPFVGTSSDPDTNQLLNWSWSWGDTTTTLHGPFPTSQGQDNAAHAWNRTGTFDVTLTVFDGYCPMTSDPYQVNVVTAPVATGWINGTVKDATTGAPPEGTTTVTAFPVKRLSTVDKTTGSYSILIGIGTYNVTAVNPLYLTKTSTGVRVTKGNTTWANLTLAPNRGWIAGWVNSSAGGPIPSAAVYVYWGAGNATSKATDANGYFNFTLTTGTYAVNASASGYYSQNKTQKSVTAQHTTIVNFQLAPIPQPSPLLSPLVVAAIAIVVIVAAVAVVVFLLGRRKKEQEKEAKLELPKK